MSDDSRQDERIEALDFEAPKSTRESETSITKRSGSGAQVSSNSIVLATRSGAPWWHSQFNLMLCVFGLLAIAAVLFISLSPSPGSAARSSTVVASDGSASLAPPTSGSPPVSDAPWDDSRRAQARTDSQDILSVLLESKKVLEAKKVIEWAPDRYQTALDQAAAGDEFYKQQDYAQAIARYQLAAEQMDSLNELLPEILKNKVKQGNQALEQGKAALAKQRFKEALLLDVNSIAALTGSGRAEVLDQVLALASSALDDEQEYGRSDELAALTSAQEKYQQALALDKLAPQARNGLIRTQNLIIDKEFRTAMSKGYRSLFAGRYSAARAAFSTALKTKPNDSTANAAYRQSLASDKSSSLSSILSAAQGNEKNEEWSNALSNYQTVLQRDPNQVNAKLGEIRSRVRSELDARLVEALSDPLSLSKSTQKQRVQSLLSDARGIKNKGSRLKQQIADIEVAIQQSEQAINVTLVSDALTEVSLLKAGAKPLRLGRFSSRKLALKPGRYVVSGQRKGFQDVRREMVLNLGDDFAAGASFDVRCDQPVVASN